jgi:hypothetical protein
MLELAAALEAGQAVPIVYLHELHGAQLGQIMRADKRVLFTSTMSWSLASPLLELRRIRNLQSR